MKLRIEVEGFEAEKAQWKERQIKFLKKIQQEEQTIRAQQQTNEELQTRITQLRFALLFLRLFVVLLMQQNLCSSSCLLGAVSETHTWNTSCERKNVS